MTVQAVDLEIGPPADGAESAHLIVRSDTGEFIDGATIERHEHGWIRATVAGEDIGGSLSWQSLRAAIAAAAAAAPTADPDLAPKHDQEHAPVDTDEDAGETVAPASAASDDDGPGDDADPGPDISSAPVPASWTEAVAGAGGAS